MTRRASIDRVRQVGLAVISALVALAASSSGAGADPLRTNTSVYEVISGDTLSGIASRFGIDVETIVQANDLRRADPIVPGQTLAILPVSGLVYRVQPGDSLLRIAIRHQVEVSSVLEWNGIRDADHIVIGSELMLPGGTVPARAVVAQASATTPRVAVAPPVAADTGSVTELEAGESFAAKVTAYSPGGGGASSSRTATGTPVRWGVLAVDPRVIPLGSRVMIEGFEDVFTAEDTGGAGRVAPLPIFYNN